MRLEERKQLAREWINFLEVDGPGEYEMEQEDIDLIKDALLLWLRQAKNYKPSIQVIIDGIPYEAK